MNKRNLTILGLLAVIAIVMSGIGFALAQDTINIEELPCSGTGALGPMKDRGFWAQLTEEQRTMLTEQIQTMLEEGAFHEEIREMKATMLQEWGIEAPQWSGPHYGEQTGGYGRRLRDGSGSGQQFGGRGKGVKGKGNIGICPYTN